eukprot:GILK01005337.1.p1 GENE.GILK01005337.1~~GILK01005337.1.p1  ORF type:complete len:251 (-),score=33.00 GILK01005337.1:341-1093(-)
MLSVAALSPAAGVSASPVTIFSPSKHPFMKRMVAVPNRFSFDPYKAARMQMNATSSVVPLPAVAAVPTQASTTFVVNAAAPSTSILPAPAASTRSVAVPSMLSFRMVMVGFKHGSAAFRAPFRVSEGDKVIVEGDRGEHIGVVSSVLPSTTAIMSNSKIIRRATAADLEAAEVKKDKEFAVMSEVIKIAKEVRLNAAIADVEFQLDLNKLTIFVERSSSSTFVDFRKLQRTLFKMFHCRIWFVYMDEVSN